MNVKQKLSILFFPKKRKANAQGKATIYVRVTIDGLKDEFSSGIHVLPNQWDFETKTFIASVPKSKEHNKKLGQIKADLERHFDLVQAKYQIAYPQTVISAYKTPVNGNYLGQQKITNLEFGTQLDSVIMDYVNLCKKIKRMKERGEASLDMIKLFNNQKDLIREQVKRIEIGFNLLTEKQKGTHRARYFMVNEVLDNNSVPIKTTGKIAGQKSIRTTEKYLRHNKKHISQNMAMVKDKLFDADGNLKIEQPANPLGSTPTINKGLRVVHVKHN